MVDIWPPFIEEETFSSLVKKFWKFNNDQLKLMIRKEFFLYDYLDNIEKREKNQLPTQEYFGNKLNNEIITYSNYESYSASLEKHLISKI